MTELRAIEALPYIAHPHSEKKKIFFYSFKRAIAKLVSRMAGGHEIVGSSPTSPTRFKFTLKGIYSTSGSCHPDNYYMITITRSTEETEQLGIELSKKCQGGDIVLLSGNLGAGKTALVKGIAKGFDIHNTITSPTFTLMNIYPVKSSQAGPALAEFNRVKQLIHIDTYRLKEERELVEIGGEDYLGKPDTICLIEWPDKIEGLLKKYDQKNFISIEIRQLENSQEREIIYHLPR